MKTQRGVILASRLSKSPRGRLKTAWLYSALRHLKKYRFVVYYRKLPDCVSRKGEMMKFWKWEWKRRAIFAKNHPKCCGRPMEDLNDIPGAFAGGDLYGCK